MIATQKTNDSHATGGRTDYNNNQDEDGGDHDSDADVLVI